MRKAKKDGKSVRVGRPLVIRGGHADDGDDDDDDDGVDKLEREIQKLKQQIKALERKLRRDS